MRVAEILDNLLSSGRILTLGRDLLGDYSGSSTNSKNPHSVSATLEGMLDGLKDAPREKRCLHCGFPKRIGAFGPDKDSADGLGAACKSCEAKRIGALGKKKKG